jgi:hypothetical protein
MGPMMTSEAVRAAVLSDQPWTRLDELVRTELAAGRTTAQIYATLSNMRDEITRTPTLSEDGEDAFGDTLDALTGNCHSDCQYRDPPNTTLPTQVEVARLPRLARLAFAGRCARRMLPLFRAMSGATHAAVSTLAQGVAAVEDAAERMPPDPELARQMVSTATNIGRSVGDYRAARAAYAVAYAMLEVEKDATLHVVTTVIDPEKKLTDLYSAVRRDFEHLVRLTEWQHWTDDTPVPPEVFGPLWPEGPPPGCPAESDVPHRQDLALELVSAARDLETMTEDRAVHLFYAINAYYIARTGHRLTMEDLRPFISTGVPAEV